MTIGRVNPSQTLDHQGITNLGAVYYNLQEPALIQAALGRSEGTLGNGGTFLVTTGKYTGRSPKDKFVVKTDNVADSVWWDNNAPMTPAAFDLLHADMLAHMQGGDFFVQDLYAGADPDHRLDVRVVSELAWHNLFIRHLLRRPARADLDGFTPEFTIINCPSFKADPARHGCRTDTVIVLNFDKQLILIGARNTRVKTRNRCSRCSTTCCLPKASCQCIVRPTMPRVIPPTAPCSSAFRALARPPCRPIRPVC